MKKIALSLAALSLLATGALASQRNSEEPNARKFIDRGTVAESVEALAVSTDAAVPAGSAFEVQKWNKLIRDNGNQ